MAEVKNKTGGNIDLVDELFNKNMASACHLSMQAGPDGFLVCVIDTKTSKFIALQSYPFSSRDLSGKISELISGSELLRCNYRSVSCAVVNGRSTLVPAALYEEEKKNELLGFNFQMDEDEEVFANNLRSVDAKNIFTVPKDLLATLRRSFPNAQMLHHSTCLVEGVLAAFRNQSGRKLVVHVQPSRFEVLVTSGKELVFYNSFRFQTSEDFIYYVLFVCEQLKLNPENTELVLLGEVERNSALYEILHKYIRHVRFGERSDNFEYSYKFNDLPKHFYFNLFSQYLCVS